VSVLAATRTIAGFFYDHSRDHCIPGLLACFSLFLLCSGECVVIINEDERRSFQESLVAYKTIVDALRTGADRLSLWKEDCPMVGYPAFSALRS
jgi:hypothetical protein